MAIPEQDIPLSQVRACVEIGIMCLDPNPENRPVTQYIMDKLKELGDSHGVHNGKNKSYGDSSLLSQNGGFLLVVVEHAELLSTYKVQMLSY